jgi:type II secretory pathway pseudopilin PulG
MKRTRTIRPAFALLDVMIAVMIVGVATTAMMSLFAAGTQAHGTASKYSVSIRLAQNMHEYALTLSHNYVIPATGTTLNTFVNGTTYSPVIDSSGNALTDSVFSGWSQYTQVTPLDPTTLQPVTVTQQSDWAWRPKRLMVTIKRNGAAVYTQRWIPAPPLQS